MARPSRRRRYIYALVLTLSGFLALFLVRAALWRPMALEGSPPSDGFTRVRGVLHVHTNLSDGGGTPEEVIQAAQAAGLDFLVITDHNHLEAKPFEGYHGSLLVLVGTEISTTSGYVLGLGIPDPVFRFSGNVQDALNDIRDLGGFAFAAHPSSSREEFAWTGWDLPGDWGLEVVNLDCQWRTAGWRIARAAGLYGLNSRLALLGLMSRPTRVIERWDSLLAARDVAGIAVPDAHSRIALSKRRAIRLPSYESLMSLALNHVLLEKPPTGDAVLDGRMLIETIAGGRSYMGVDALASAEGFFFEAVGMRRRWTMGDTVRDDPRPLLRAGGRVPRGARFVMFHDGRRMLENEGSVEAEAPGPGVFRVEVYVPGWETPWIVSNPIYVFAPEDAASRKRHASLASDPEAPTAIRVIDSFEEGTILRPEFDPSSSMNAEIRDTRAPWLGRGCGRMEFSLGAGDGPIPSSWCALVNRASHDLSGRRGLVLAIKGDGEYRVHVQLRDVNPFGRDEGHETWFTSVKTSRAWRRVSAPFACFRSTDPRSDGRLDLDQVRMLAFVIDRGADKVGTTGTIWFDDIGIY
ncbi:MAG: hypothetical protein JXO72_16200 [Vicinamibacteria bacterium]|nr:hypothetical protein [Vicinamibacteria bacterium]